MARRVSWTNNSSGHLGTRIYRAPTLDPQNLPVPVATVDPVAQGETAEWIDTEDLTAGDYEYAVRDYDGSGEGALSAVLTHNIAPEGDQVGDYVEGGVYAGIFQYGDGRSFKLILSLQAAESASLKWSANNGDKAGAESPDDGYANTDHLVNAFGDFPAAEYCATYTDGDFIDGYLAAPNEWAFIGAALSGHPELSASLSTNRWSSQQNDPYTAYTHKVSDGTQPFVQKTYSSPLTRPIRRIPV